MSEIFECSGQNSINLSCQFWTDKSIPLHIFASLFVVMPHNSPVSFEVIKFPLLVKGSHESPNFETLECSGSNLPDSSCHFWKQESLFLQILYQSSVLSHIPSLYFFGSNIIYFGQKQTIKVQIFETFECSSQNLSISFPQFRNDKSFFLFRHSSVSLNVSPL